MPTAPWPRTRRCLANSLSGASRCCIIFPRGGSAPMAKTSRRDFLKATGVSVAGAALGGTASSYGRILGANDRVGIGIVGFSDRTRSSLIPSFAKVAGPLNFELVAVSDIWNRRRDEGAAYIAKLTGKRSEERRVGKECRSRWSPYHL